MTSDTPETRFYASTTKPDHGFYPPPNSASDGSDHKVDGEGFWKNAKAAAIPSLGACLKATLSVTVVLYILNQKHMLPRPLGAIVSKVLFWPTLPITISRRIGRWESVIDETVVMGGAPFGFARLPEKLYYEYGVSCNDSTLIPVYGSRSYIFLLHLPMFLLQGSWRH